MFIPFCFYGQLSSWHNFLEWIVECFLSILTTIKAVLGNYDSDEKILNLWNSLEKKRKLFVTGTHREHSKISLSNDIICLFNNSNVNYIIYDME